MYVPPIEETVGGKTQLIEQVQTSSFLVTLRWIFAGAPITLLCIALFFASRYPLAAETHQRLRSLLTARRSGAPETTQQTAEAEALKERLIG